MISVREVLLDPDITDLILVSRRRETVSMSTGRSEIVVEKEFPNTQAVVCAASPNDLERLDDSQRMGRNLSIVTTFPLRGPSPGYQPDLISWHGDLFIVKLVDPYPQYGEFVQAIAGSIDSIDMAPPGLGKTDFADQSQSNLVGVT